jgi:hypothetical protein
MHKARLAKSVDRIDNVDVVEQNVWILLGSTAASLGEEEGKCGWRDEGSYLFKFKYKKYHEQYYNFTSRQKTKCNKWD